MSRPHTFTQPLIDCRDSMLVGGKAVNLGRLVRLRFPVPDGFVVTTRAFRFAQTQSNGNGVPAALPVDVADEILAAYQSIGGGPVAVRSSATAEDMAAASMAGQYETFLDIVGDVALLDAVRRCWASLDSPRIRSYLHEHSIDPARVAMAVVVQKLVSADVAGVLFTANPHTGTMGEMLVEASWGLGESVVSGRVQPDVLRLERKTGRVLAATIADKRVHLAAGAGEERPVEESRRRMSCLRGRDVHRLWEVGTRVAEQFGSPQDIEWAIHQGEIFVLQSRPITTLAEAEAYEEVLRTTRQFLRDQSKAARGPWALHNLAETLQHPTPLTWSVICRFMSGAGGFGTMYREVGFEPSPTVTRDGFLDCIGGRIYMDASRAPEMFFENFPFAYDLEELRRSPDASQTPPTLPRGKFSVRMNAVRRLTAVNAKLQEMSADLDRRLNTQVFPEFADWSTQEKQRDLSVNSPEKLIEIWQHREKKVLDEFAPQSLLPSLISGMALADLRTFLATNCWDDDPDALSQLISSGGPPNRTVVADAELHEVGVGIRQLEQWIEAHGHRAAGEFDLAAVRWREQPAAAREMAVRLAGGDRPLERHRRHGEEVNARITQLGSRLPARDCAELNRLVDLVRRYVAFREDGKDFLMLGYDLLRDVALEAGRRLEIGEDVFYLTREDLFDSLRVGFAPLHLIQQRKNAYRAEARLTLPRVIDESSIDAIGETPEVKAAAGAYKAFAVSSGNAAGPARVRRSPTEAGDLGRGYILVCPSTDPSWTPLFVNAAALVLECGGTLSHGAVVAREMGLPAVVLPDATRLFQDGEEIRVDGRAGAVSRVADEAAKDSSDSVLANAGTNDDGTATSDASKNDTAFVAVDPDDLHVSHELIPPPPGRKDGTAAKIRNISAIAWTLYLLAAFLLPEQYLYQPSLSFLDMFLWPIARGLGKPAVVAIVAAAVAALTLIIQKFVTDNRRLLVAKRRAALLTKQARALPAGSARRTALTRLAAPVQMRILLAALAPIAICLGPMVMTFFWLMERVEPSKWNAEPGASVQVVATLDSSFMEPVVLNPPAPLELDPASPSVSKLPPIRAILEELRIFLSQPRVDPSAPAIMQFLPDFFREQLLASLKAYLDAGIPPQSITWTIRAPEGLAGRFPITIAAGNHPPTIIYMELGNTFPPSPRTIDGARGSPVKELKVSYVTEENHVFWRPLERFEHLKWVPTPARLAAWHMGWLMDWLVVYIVAYLPVLFGLRAILRLA